MLNHEFGAITGILMFILYSTDVNQMCKNGNKVTVKCSDSETWFIIQPMFLGSSVENLIDGFLFIIEVPVHLDVVA